MPNEEAIQKMSIVDPIQVNVNIPNFEGKPGRDGTDGRDGDDAYRIAVRNGFFGTEKEWLLTLKGQDGKSASAPTARQALLQNNVWCEDDTVDSVFTAIIGNWGKPMPRNGFTTLTIPNVVQGQKRVAVTGEPHYTVKVLSNNTSCVLNGYGEGVLVIPPMGEDNINLTYHNYLGEKVEDYMIEGVQVGPAADEEYTENGIVYKRYGSTLEMNITNNTVNGNFNDNPKGWNITQKNIYANSPTTLNLSDTVKNYGAYYVKTPENVKFTASNNKIGITLSTDIQPTKFIKFTLNEVVWSTDSNTYINTGYHNDGI